jgi:hypothetical protein
MLPYIASTLGEHHMNTLEQLKSTALIRLFTFLKIPLLWWVHPSVIENDDTKTILKIPLTRRTKNHLGVMYFGSLAMGAEAAVAIKAIQTIQKSGKKVDFIFKDFKADFLKRAEGDVHFICEQGPAVKALVEKCIASGERENETYRSYAVVPSKSPTEVVAEFQITLSVKRRK